MSPLPQSATLPGAPAPAGAHTPHLAVLAHAVENPGCAGARGPGWVCWPFSSDQQGDSANGHVRCSTVDTAEMIRSARPLDISTITRATSAPHRPDPLRFFGPWQFRPEVAKIGRTSRLKSTYLAAAAGSDPAG